jgi:lipid-A-disaccharide synthase
MRYFLVAGEASGDLHAANLILEIKHLDTQADFRFFGGDKMAEVGGAPVMHYRNMAYMGFVDVLLHARTLLRIMNHCKQEIASWHPDVVILVDYASFNLRIAKYVKSQWPGLPVHFYISPKLWAWKTYRIHSFKRYIDRLYVIFPFEPAFFRKYAFEANYVGNPSVDSVSAYTSLHQPDMEAFRHKYDLDERPILALLPGSRRSEIKGNLPLMLDAAAQFSDYQVVVAGAPGVSIDFYDALVPKGMPLVFNETYPLLLHTYAALVTSGTATLETALFEVPQVVCYAVNTGWVANLVFALFMKVTHISLVNLIVGKELVPELMGGKLSRKRIVNALKPLLGDTQERRTMLQGYAAMKETLGGPGAAMRTAESIVSSLR